MYYLSNVYPPIEESQSFDDYFPLAPIISGVPATRPPAHLILAGYSYGALLTRFLPRVPVLLGRFAKVLKTSTEAEIRLRAAKLAAVTHIDILSRPLYGLRESHKTRKGKERERGNRPRGQLEETPRDWTVEKDGHMQYLQKPFVRKQKRDSWPDQHNELGPDADDYIARVYVPTPKTHYLLISLLLEPLASFCTGFRILGDTELDTKFLYNSTMMLHGEKDRLTSFKKLSFWADDLVEDSEGKCNVVGVENSGHFWRDKKAIESLKFSIGFWVLITVNDERQSS